MNSDAILSDIRKIIRSINLESKRIQKEHGLSIPQLLCLKFLQAQVNSQATHSAIREAVSLNPSTVTGIIDRLEKKALVARLPKENDRRASLVTLTDSGLEILKNTPALLHDQLHTKLGQLPQNDIINITKALKQLVGILGIEALDAAPLFANEEPLL